MERDHRRRAAAHQRHGRRSRSRTAPTHSACYLISNVGFFRSDDGGATWQQMAADDTRIRNGQGGYNCGVYVDPKNPDIVYTSTRRATTRRDGGKHLHRIQRRAGRRRSAAEAGSTHQRQAHDPRLRPGRDRVARRRRHVELVVQPVDRAGLSRRRRTTRSRTGSTRRSRTPAPCARASAATSAPSRRSTGIP